MAQAKKNDAAVDVAEAAVEEVKVSAIQVVGDAANAAQAQGDHAAHAVLDDINQSLFILKQKLDAGIQVAGDDARELLEKLRGVL